MFSKSICCTKEHWWPLTSSWPDEVKECFRLPKDFIKLTFDTTNDFHELISYMIDFSLSYYVLFIICDVNLNSSSTRM